MNLIRSRSLPSGPPRIPESQLRAILTKVLDSPPLAGFFGGAAIAGLDRAAVQGSAMRKLRHLIKPSKAPRLSAAARVRELEKKLSRANVLEAVEIRRQLEFAKLEAKRGVR